MVIIQVNLILKNIILSSASNKNGNSLDFFNYFTKKSASKVSLSSIISSSFFSTSANSYLFSPTFINSTTRSCLLNI